MSTAGRGIRRRGGRAGAGAGSGSGSGSRSGAAHAAAEADHDEESKNDVGIGFGFRKSASQQNLAAQLSEKRLIQTLSPLPSELLRPQASPEIPGSPMSVDSATAAAAGPLFNMASIFTRQGINAISDDTFTRCFQSKPPRHWNWNCEQMPLRFFFCYCFLVVVVLPL